MGEKVNLSDKSDCEVGTYKSKFKKYESKTNSKMLKKVNMSDTSDSEIETYKSTIKRNEGGSTIKMWKKVKLSNKLNFEILKCKSELKRNDSGTYSKMLENLNLTDTSDCEIEACRNKVELNIPRTDSKMSKNVNLSETSDCEFQTYKLKQKKPQVDTNSKMRKKANLSNTFDANSKMLKNLNLSDTSDCEIEAFKSKVEINIPHTDSKMSKNVNPSDKSDCEFQMYKSKHNKNQADTNSKMLKNLNLSDTSDCEVETYKNEIKSDEASNSSTVLKNLNLSDTVRYDCGVKVYKNKIKIKKNLDYTDHEKWKNENLSHTFGCGTKKYKSQITRNGSKAEIKTLENQTLSDISSSEGDEYTITKIDPSISNRDRKTKKSQILCGKTNCEAILNHDIIPEQIMKHFTYNTESGGFGHNGKQHPVKSSPGKLPIHNRSSRKRRLQTIVSETKSPKVAKCSPTVNLMSGSKLKLPNCFVYLENSSSQIRASPRNKIGKASNSLKHLPDTDSPKRISAKKNLFSPEKRSENLNTKVCLNKCTPIKEQKMSDNQTESPLKHNINVKQLLTPQKNIRSATKQSYIDLENTCEKINKTPKKDKGQRNLLNDFKGECESVKKLNELSPCKNISTVTDDFSSDKKITRSVTKPNSPMKSNSPLAKSDLISKTKKKMFNCTSKYDSEKLNTPLKHLNEQSPSKTIKTCSKMSSSSLKKTTKRTSTLEEKIGQLDNVEEDIAAITNRTPVKGEKHSKEEKQGKKENININSKKDCFTPNKGKHGIGSNDTHSPSTCSNIKEIDNIQKLSSPLLKKSITVTTPISKRSTGRGFLTPSMAKKEYGTCEKKNNALDITRKQLHISTIPKSLPCRDAEFSQIKTFLIRKIEHCVGGCMYISGVPGTGKTATVHAVIRSLQEEVDGGELPEFDFVEVNGLRLTDPKQAYVRIHQTLTDQKLTSDQAQQLLSRRFSGTCKKSTIILVDELDYLCNRRQDVVYNILDWPTKRNSGLVVLTISNTMDLPERTLKGRVTSRMGLTRVMFQPYSHHQLRQIVQDRLCGSSTFHPDAVQLVARKVAAVSGDARRALDICRRTTELVQHGEQVTAGHVEQALTQIFSGPRVIVIQSLSQLCQLVLRSLRDVNQRSGVDEATVCQVYRHLEQICVLEGVMLPTTGTVLQCCVTLVGLGLLVAEKGRMDITRKMSLNVSSDDIHYALDNLKS